MSKLTSENKLCCLVLSLFYDLSQRSLVVTIRVTDKKLTRDLRQNNMEDFKNPESLEKGYFLQVVSSNGFNYPSAICVLSN